MSQITIDGLTVTYDDAGTGDVLLLVHGHPFDRSMWRPQVEHFGARGWRVIAPDLRGYGDSSVVPGVTTLETFARDLVGLLDRLGVGEIVLGGLSMGGQIVMELHRLFPARIRGLLLAATSARAEDAAGKERRYEAAERLSREGMAGYARETLTRMISPRNAAERPDLAAHVRHMMLTAPPEGAAAALRGRAERPDYLGSLSRVEVPTLVVVGTDDDFTPVPEAELLVRTIPGARLEVVAGAAHLPNLERPGAFHRALQGLLDEVTARAVAAG